MWWWSNTGGRCWRGWCVDRSDALVGVGALLIGAALWFLVGWPGVLAWLGFLLTAVGVAEAKRK